MIGGVSTRRASAVAECGRGAAALWVPVKHGCRVSRKSVGTTGGDAPLLPMNPNAAVPPPGAMTPFHAPAVFDAASTWPDGKNVAFQPLLKLSAAAAVQFRV